MAAIVGSVYTFPRTPVTIKEFGDNVLSDAGKWIKTQVSFATDALNNICMDITIGAYKVAENIQATRF